MIHLSAKGKEEEIATLICTIWNKSTTDAWISNRADWQHMLTCTKDGKIQAFLQVRKRTLSIAGRTCTISLLDEGFVHPGLPAGEAAGMMRALITTAMNISRRSDLFCAMKTRHPETLEELGFITLDQSKRAVISPELLELSGDAALHLQSFDLPDLQQMQQLFVLYRSFMKLFDASILLNYEQFEDLMQNKLDNGAKIVVCHSTRHSSSLASGLPDHQPAGFMVLEPGSDETADISLCVYQDLNVLEAFLQHGLLEYEQLFWNAAGCEPVQAYLARPDEHPEDHRQDENQVLQLDLAFCLHPNQPEFMLRWLEELPLQKRSNKALRKTIEALQALPANNQMPQGKDPQNNDQQDLWQTRILLQARLSLQMKQLLAEYLNQLKCPGHYAFV